VFEAKPAAPTLLGGGMGFGSRLGTLLPPRGLLGGCDQRSSPVGVLYEAEDGADGMAPGEFHSISGGPESPPAGRA